MKIAELIEMLKQFPDDAEIFIRNFHPGIHDITAVYAGWLVDDEDISDIIPDSENPENYDINPNQTKVIALE